MRCFYVFADDKKLISIIKEICGKEVLFKMLNEEKYLESNSERSLINYIQAMKLPNEEEEEMFQIIKSRETIEELKTKEITSFSYPQLEYLYLANEEILIIPSFDGDKCEFSISPSLPNGIIIDKESGIIYGEVKDPSEKREYEVICRNIRNEKKFKIFIDIFDIKFTNLNKSKGISILSNAKVMKSIHDDFSHCYLNVKMENGIYHIKYQFHQNGNTYNTIFLGLSTNNTFSGKYIFNKSTTCNYFAYSGRSQDISGYCHIGKVVNKNPNFFNHGDGSIYEIIIDMNKREFWISHNNSSPVLLVKDLPSPLYPYAVLYYQNTSIEIQSFSHQD